MPNITVKITNLPQIKAAFAKAPSLMAKNLNAAIAKTVFDIKRGEFEEYKALGIRVITSGLWASIERGQYLKNLYGEVGPNVTGSPGVPYAGFVHSGTYKMKARPFLYNAVQNKQRSVDDYFKKAVQDTLDSIARDV